MNQVCEIMGKYRMGYLSASEALDRLVSSGLPETSTPTSPDTLNQSPVTAASLEILHSRVEILTSQIGTLRSEFSRSASMARDTPTTGQVEAMIATAMQRHLDASHAPKGLAPQPAPTSSRSTHKAVKAVRSKGASRLPYSL